MDTPQPATGLPPDAPAEPDLQPSFVVLRPRRRSELDAWLLVLEAEGRAYRLGRDDGGRPLLLLPEEGAEATIAALRAWRDENRPPNPLPPAKGHPGAWRLGLAWLLTLAGLFALSGEASTGSAWQREGAALAGRLLAGEPYRAVTALTLHADLGHLLANLLSGTLLATAVARALGPGLGALGLVAAGTGGNLLAALLRPEQQASIGASTAVFGAVGLLAGLAWDRRHRAGWAGQGLWLPLAAGLGLLALLGSNPDTDVLAHALGFVAGIPLGLAAGRLEEAGPRGLQAAAGTGAALLLAGGWWAALGG